MQSTEGGGGAAEGCWNGIIFLSIDLLVLLPIAFAASRVVESGEQGIPATHASLFFSNYGVLQMSSHNWMRNRPYCFFIRM